MTRKFTATGEPDEGAWVDNQDGAFRIGLQYGSNTSRMTLTRQELVEFRDNIDDLLLEPVPHYGPLTAKDFELQYDATHRYMFFEDEFANGLYAYGHDHDAKFAAEVNAYDLHCSGYNDWSAYTAEDVSHYWAVVTDPEMLQFTWKGVTESTPGAFPVSVIYR